LSFGTIAGRIMLGTSQAVEESSTASQLPEGA
jgi:hypothetical protein